MSAHRPHAGGVWRAVLLTATLTFGVAASAGAQSTDPATTPEPAAADRTAIATIVMNSVAEVRLCDLALAKSHNADVRSFCRGVTKDHARTAIAGMQLAQTLGAGDVKLEPSPGTSELIDSLNHYSGHEFDRAFLLTQIEDHENDQETLRYASEVAVDSAVKQYEQNVLPHVQRYLHLAEGTLDSISADQP